MECHTDIYGNNISLPVAIVHGWKEGMLHFENCVVVPPNSILYLSVGGIK